MSDVEPRVTLHVTKPKFDNFAFSVTTCKDSQYGKYVALNFISDVSVGNITAQLGFSPGFSPISVGAYRQLVEAMITGGKQVFGDDFLEKK